MSVWRSLWAILGWGMVLAVIYLSLTPQPPPIGGAVWDKAGHALSYLVLMLWFAQLTEPRLPLAAALLALGGGLEVAQGFTGYRQASGLDLLANALGIATGWLAARHLPNPLRWLETCRR